MKDAIDRYGGRDQTIATNTGRVGTLVQMAAEDMAKANNVVRVKIPFRDIERVKAAASEYLDICAANGTLPTVRGMAAQLGYTRSAVYERARTHPDEEFAKFLEDFSDICGELTMAAALEGSVNVVAAIFTAKARYNWRDVVTIEAPVHNPLGENISAEEIEQKYMDLP